MAENKKIGLITFAPHANCGTCLQSYALNYVLRKMGYSVEFLYNGVGAPPESLSYSIKQYLLRTFPKFGFRIVGAVRKVRPSSGEQVAAEPMPYIHKLSHSPLRFLCSKLPFYSHLVKWFTCHSRQDRRVFDFTYNDGNYVMRRIYTHRQYRKILKETDVFITGSDQIWNPFCWGFNPFMFLEFVDGVKCISYSSSISRPSLPSSLKERIRKDLSKFEHIAVREKTSAVLLNDLLGRNDVRVVVDPVLLLSEDEWKSFSQRAGLDFSLPEDYIFCYFIGDRIGDYSSMVKDVLARKGKRNVITFDCTRNTVNYGDGILYREGGPYEFVYLLSHSGMVCTDSFHATVLSLIFKLDFVHILKSENSESTGSQNIRMEETLSHYGLTYKLYDSRSDRWMEGIDYKHVDSVIQTEISDSMDFLKFEIEK